MKKSMIEHLTICQSLSIKRNGGLVQVAALHKAMLEEGISSRLVYTEWGDSIDPPQGSIKLKAVCGNPFFFGWKSASQLRAAISIADVVHVHGLYTYMNYLAGKYSRQFGKALIYHPHGSLAPAFLKRGRLKKRIVKWAFENRNFRELTAWRALTNYEAEQIRAISPHARVMVVPNGVHLPNDNSRVQGRHPRLQLMADPGKRIFLFLSRISRVKGLDLLLDAWHGATPTLRRCELWIAGVDYDGTEKLMRGRIRSLGIQNAFILGAVSEDEKQWLLRASDVFVLLSRGEGQSPAVLEALAFGKPVLLTKSCFFPDASTYNAGYECNDCIAEIREHLMELSKMPDDRLNVMGQHGRSLVATKYDIRKVARDVDSLTSAAIGSMPFLVEIPERPMFLRDPCSEFQMVLQRFP